MKAYCKSARHKPLLCYNLGMPSAADPIAIYDSGVGGLSVLRAIRELLPQENLIYFGDQAHVPYGQRSMEELRALAEVATRFFIAQGAKLVVVACNTASAAALKQLRQSFPEMPFVGMEPAVKPASEQTHSGRVGVLATPATFAGELYASVVARFAQDVQVHQSVCPGLVAQIEKGDLDGPETRRILQEAIEPMLAAGADTLVMGCTHYPFVIPLIEELAGGRAQVIDPSPAIARQVKRLLEAGGLLASADQAGEMRFYTSAEPRQFSRILKQLTAIQSEARALRWEGGEIEQVKGNAMLEPIVHRRSIRKYTDQAVEPEKLETVLTAARLAPSGNNKQPWHFIVVREQERREAIARVCNNQTWMLSAPLFIVAVADASERNPQMAELPMDEETPNWELKRAIRDTAIAVENLLLEADNQGLGTCWVGFFTQDVIRPLVGLPRDKFVLAVIPLGYPAEEPNPRTRKPLDEIVRYEHW